jgi:hypothetical protein
MPVGQNACWTKCLLDKMSVGQNACRTKCLSDKMPVSQMLFDQKAKNPITKMKKRGGEEILRKPILSYLFV